jgi:cell division protein FtsQ
VDEPRRRGPVANRTLILVTAAVMLVAGVATWIVAFSTVLGVKTVTIQGTQTLSVAQIRSAAAIKAGTPLIRLDTAGITRRIEAISEVAAAKVAVHYPSTVLISVTERTPVGYEAVGRQYLLVDRTGTQYRTVSAVPGGLPRFAIPDGPQAQPTGRGLATVAAALTPALRARIASIEAFDPTSITLLLNDHRVVRWGGADRSADKARILPALLMQAGTRFDVSNPDQVFAH